MQKRVSVEWLFELYGLSDAVCRRLEQALEEAAAREGDTPVGLSVQLVQDGRMRVINRQNRGVDQTTDVLSFPTVRWGKNAKANARALLREYDPQLKCAFIGDIVLSIPRARDQADAFGHSDLREAAYLLVHGFLHLMGYDHETPGEREVMREKEEAALDAAGLGRANQECLNAVWLESAQSAPQSLGGLEKNACEMAGTACLRDEQCLIEKAQVAMANAYAPYSEYSVGACIETSDGRLFSGCNVENASFGLCICAERSALSAAVAAGARDFVRIAVSAKKSLPFPCGACRQVLYEFAPSLEVIAVCGEKRETRMLCDLLPDAFGPKSLT